MLGDAQQRYACLPLLVRFTRVAHHAYCVDVQPVGSIPRAMCTLVITICVPIVEQVVTRCLSLLTPACVHSHELAHLMIHMLLAHGLKHVYYFCLPK